MAASFLRKLFNFRSILLFTLFWAILSPVYVALFSFLSERIFFRILAERQFHPQDALRSRVELRMWSGRQDSGDRRSPHITMNKTVTKAACDTTLASA